VFGEGPSKARLLFVGEQPGDVEDIAGRPFVGPAGRIFDRALAEAGIERANVYVTNAVKHFKFEQRGKRRLHKRPDAGEIEICRWWISRELEIIEPELVVALGATAARSLAGRPMPIERSRGELLPFGSDRARMLVTVHPSYLLRLREEEDRDREYARFVTDLKLVASAQDK
jgi:DNA polymerase